MSTKQEIIDYIKYTPHNTNLGVLKSMLDNFGGYATCISEIEMLELLSEEGIIEPMINGEGAFFIASEDILYVF